MSIWRPAEEISQLAEEIVKIQRSYPRFPSDSLEEAGVEAGERHKLSRRLHAHWKKEQQRLIRNRKKKIQRRMEKL